MAADSAGLCACCATLPADAVRADIICGGAEAVGTEGQACKSRLVWELGIDLSLLFSRGNPARQVRCRLRQAIESEFFACDRLRDVCESLCGGTRLFRGLGYFKIGELSLALLSVYECPIQAYDPIEAYHRPY